MSRAETVRRVAYLCLLALVGATACRSDSLMRGDRSKAIKDGVTPAESLAIKPRSRPSRTMLGDDGPCTIDFWDPGAISGCAMSVPSVTPEPWLEHSGGIYEPAQTDPISIKFAGPVQGVTIQSSGALKCGGSSLGRLIGFRNGSQVADVANWITDPEDCGEDDVTWSVSGALDSATTIDSLVIEGVDPWQFSVLGQSGGRALLRYTVTFVRALQVIVTADTNHVIATDSLSFKAALTDSAELTPVGWRWQPLVDTLWDPWTKACSGTPSTCKIQVHGSGTMYFKATRQNGDSVVGSVAIVADLPPAAQDEGDAPIPADEIVTANLLSAKMLDLLEPTTVGPEISEQQGVYIAGNAILSGQWTYTQGCAQCYRVVKIDDTTTATIGDSIWVRLHGPNTEDSVNTALKRGDCTDYTMTAIRNVLGSFPFPKLSTTMFNHWVADSAAAADSLLKYGYTQVAFPRTGDVVVRARNGPTRWNGHAGIFIGWAAGMSSGVRTDSVPIGWANNGNPAGYLPNDTNYTLKTGSTGFKAGASFITKFFRPHTGS